MPFTYLASPYSHRDADVMKHRYEMACQAAAALADSGVVVFSPIAHGQSIEPWRNSSTSAYVDWADQCEGMLEAADRLMVLNLEGVEQSVGVRAEIEFAVRHRIPIAFVDFGDLFPVVRAAA